MNGAGIPPDRDRARKALAAEIHRWLLNGVSLSPEAEQYMAACLDGIDLAALEGRRENIPDIDTAPLMELVFFPDLTLQVRIEPLVASHCFGPDDQIAVVRRLSGHRPHARIRRRGTEESAVVALPEWILSTLVHRLHITRRLPDALLKVLAQVAEDGTRRTVQVMLRNRTFPFTAGTIDFLGRFFYGAGMGTNTFFSTLAAALTLLEDQQGRMDPFCWLSVKKNRLMDQMHLAEQFERHLKTDNMETLMLRGIRPPETSREAAARNLEDLVRVGNAVACGTMRYSPSAET